MEWKAQDAFGHSYVTVARRGGRTTIGILSTRSDAAVARGDGRWGRCLLRLRWRRHGARQHGGPRRRRWRRSREWRSRRAARGRDARGVAPLRAASRRHGRRHSARRSSRRRGVRWRKAACESADGWGQSRSDPDGQEVIAGPLSPDERDQSLRESAPPIEVAVPAGELARTSRDSPSPCSASRRCRLDESRSTPFSSRSVS